MRKTFVADVQRSALKKVVVKLLLEDLILLHSLINSRVDFLVRWVVGSAVGGSIEGWL